MASQTIGPADVDIGDSFTFQVELDLPGVTSADKSNLEFELFGLDANDGSKA